MKEIDGVDVYICLGSSAQELPDIEELHGLNQDKTIVFFNLKLDVLRGDLGAPAFPPKSSRTASYPKSSRSTTFAHGNTVAQHPIRRLSSTFRAVSFGAIPGSFRPC